MYRKTGIWWQSAHSDGIAPTTTGNPEPQHVYQVEYRERIEWSLQGSAGRPFLVEITRKRKLLLLVFVFIVQSSITTCTWTTKRSLCQPRALLIQEDSFAHVLWVQGLGLYQVVMAVPMSMLIHSVLYSARDSTVPHITHLFSVRHLNLCVSFLMML